MVLGTGQVKPKTIKLVFAAYHSKLAARVRGVIEAALYRQ